MRPIDADALMTEVLKGTIISADLYGMGIMAGVDSFAKKLEAALTLTLDDLRPKGRWKLADDGDGVVCSECGTDFCILIYATDDFRFCPSCGADMRGGGIK